MDYQEDICMTSANLSSDCQLTESSQAPQPQPLLSASSDASATAASLSPSKFSSSTPTKQQQQPPQQQHNAGFELHYTHGPGGAMDVSLRTPSGARYYNPFLRWEPNACYGAGSGWTGLGGHHGGITVSPGIFAPTAAVAVAAAAVAAAATLSPDHRARVCPDTIDSSEETALKQEAYSARLTEHWDSQFCVQDAIEAYFKSQVIAPSPAGFDDGRGGRRCHAGPHVDCETDSAPRWNVSTQTILSIPAFFDLAAIISDDDEVEANNCCGGCYGEPAAVGAAESSPVRPSPPQSQLPVTPDRVVKAFQVLPSSGSPQLGQQNRPKLLPNFQPMEAIRERSCCSMDTTSDSQQASLYSASHQQLQQHQIAASNCEEASCSFLTASSGSVSDLVATPTAGGASAAADGLLTPT